MPSISKATKLNALGEEEWRSIANAHFSEAEKFTAGPRARRDRQQKHPIEDFLFEYYPYPFSLLEAWHPEPNQYLLYQHEEELPTCFLGKFYTRTDKQLFLDSTRLNEKNRTRMRWVLELLEATEKHTPIFSCHGLHEWAMVYQAEEVRHEQTTPMRLSQKEIDTVVESRPLVCTHHDAFRFFAKSARPLNRFSPTLETRMLNEQPGCVHVNMDLYKWAAKMMPWSGSKLLIASYQLAHELRELDMCASPYDLSQWGYSPVKIETEKGRLEYEKQQRKLAKKAAVLRRHLIDRLKSTLALPI